VAKMPLDIVKETQQILGRGEGKLHKVLPTAIERLILERAWEGRNKKIGFDVVPFSGFQDFVDTQLPWGLGSSIDDLMNYCRKYPKVQQLIQREALNADGKSTRQIAEENGMSQSAVVRALNRSSGSGRDQSARLTIFPGTNPKTAAQRIREKLGDSFADQLADQLKGEL